jgi:hypothetical protein
MNGTQWFLSKIGMTRSRVGYIAPRSGLFSLSLVPHHTGMTVGECTLASFPISWIGNDFQDRVHSIRSFVL